MLLIFGPSANQRLCNQVRAGFAQGILDFSFPAIGPPDPGTDSKAPGSLTHHRFRHLLLKGPSLSGTKIASQNRSDHGGRKRARNDSAAEIAGFFASPAAKKSLAASDFWG